MKSIILFTSVCLLFMSCSSAKQSVSQEDELFLTRKYVGDFVECSYTKPERFGDPFLVSIKTTLEDTYGKISAYSKICKFQPGERLYIRKKYINRGGIWGDWIYQIESDNDKTSYMLSQLQYGEKILNQEVF